MADLKSRTWIIIKGITFLVIALLCGGLLLQESPTLRTALLVSILVWSSARFYYFVFYVLEHYVDPTLKYAGIFALLRAIRQRSRRERSDYRQP